MTVEREVICEIISDLRKNNPYPVRPASPSIIVSANKIGAVND
jgi:hypothetical protein